MIKASTESLIRREVATSNVRLMSVICLCLHSIAPFYPCVYEQVNMCLIPYSFRNGCKHKSSFMLSI